MLLPFVQFSSILNAKSGMVHGAVTLTCPRKCRVMFHNHLRPIPTFTGFKQMIRTFFGDFTKLQNILHDRFEVGKVGYAHKNRDRKSTRLNSSHVSISYAVFCLKKKRNK